jgi:hypothetical protein
MTERAAPPSLTPAEVSRLLATLPSVSTTGVATAEVTLRFQEYWRATQSGSSFVEALRGRPAFGNPYLLAEVIATFQIEDTPEHGVPSTDFYDVLAQGMRTTTTSTTTTDGDGNIHIAPIPTSEPLSKAEFLKLVMTMKSATTTDGDGGERGTNSGSAAGGGATDDVSVIATTSSDAPVATKKSRWQ